MKTIRAALALPLALTLACGARSSLRDDGSSSSSSGAGGRGGAGGAGGDAPHGPACKPGDPVATLHTFAPGNCTTVLFGIDDSFVYVPESEGVLRIPKAGGASENILPGYAGSTFVNPLGIFAEMLIPGCSMAPCTRLVRVRGSNDAVELASPIGPVFMLEPWGSDRVAFTHVYPDPGGQVSAAGIDGGGFQTLQHFQLGVPRQVLDGDVVYARTFDTGELLAVDLAKGTQSIVPGSSDVQSTPAVVQDYVYFTDAAGEIARIAKKGGTVEIMSAPLDPLVGRMAFVARGTDLFFNELPITPGSNTGTDGQIVTFDTMNGDIRTLAGAPDVGPVSFITVDDDCVYWSEARWATESGGECAEASIKRAPR